MTLTLKQKVLLVFLAVLFGIAFSLPHILIPQLLPMGKTYHPLLPIPDGTMQVVDEAHIYAPKVASVKNGRLIRDQGVEENRAQLSPVVSEILPALMLSGLSTIGGNIEHGFMLGDALMPPVIFLLGFWLLWKETRKFLISASGAGLTLFADPLMKWVFYPQRIAAQLYASENWQSMLALTRQFPPEAVLPVWLLFIASFIQYLKSSGKKHRFIAIISGALLAYNYSIYLLNTILGIALFFLVLLLKRDWKLIQRLIVLLGIIGVFWIPLLVATIMIFASGVGSTFTEKYEQTPVLPEYFLASSRYWIFLLLFIPFPRKKSNGVLFLLCLLWASFLLYLAPILGILKIASDRFILLLRSFPYIASLLLFISSKDLLLGGSSKNFRSFRWFFSLLLVFLFPWRKYMAIASLIVFLAISCAYLFIPLFIRKRFYTPLLTMMLLISIIHPFWIHYQFSKHVGQSYTFTPDQEQLVQWVTINTKPDTVFGMLDLEESLWFQVHTSRYLYYPRTFLTTLSIDSLEDRFLTLNAVLGIPKNQIIFSGIAPSNVVTKSGLNENKWLSWYGYGLRYYDQKEKSFIVPLAEEKRIKNRYADQTLTDGCHVQGRLNYLLVGPYTKTYLITNIKPCWAMAYQNPTYAVYQASNSTQ